MTKEQEGKDPPDLRLIGQGHFKVKVVSRSWSFQGQGHFKVKVVSRVMVLSRSRSFQGYGRFKVKGLVGVYDHITPTGGKSQKKKKKKERRIGLY